MAASENRLIGFINRIFPKAPDFYLLLHEQATQVSVTIDNLTKFFASHDLEAGKQLKDDEHQADRLRIRNLQSLNHAFSTTIDREDIFRAIDAMDGIVTHSKISYNELKVLNIHPDSACLAIALELQQGVRALEQGFAILAHNPNQAQHFAMTARHAKRRIEKLNHKALAGLFVGDDYLHMFKMREFYRHLEHISLRMNICANVMEDIVVKMN
jgi:uncharacterized protein